MNEWRIVRTECTERKSFIFIFTGALTPRWGYVARSMKMAIIYQHVWHWYHGAFMAILAKQRLTGSCHFALLLLTIGNFKVLRLKFAMIMLDT